MLTARYRQTCNHIRPHGSLGYRPPAPGGYPACRACPDARGTTIIGGTSLGGRSKHHLAFPSELSHCLAYGVACGVIDVWDSGVLKVKYATFPSDVN